MDEVFARSRVLAPPDAPVRLPIAHMVCNQMPPVGDKPSLMTFREVTNSNLTGFLQFGISIRIVYDLLLSSLATDIKTLADNTYVCEHICEQSLVVQVP